MGTIEFLHLLKTMVGNQFDQTYHEHFSYFSALTVDRVFAAHGMRLFDVEVLWTHGGSSRIIACLANATRPKQPLVAALIAKEREARFDPLEIYPVFVDQVRATKRKLLGFLLDAKEPEQARRRL